MKKLFLISCSAFLLTVNGYSQDQHLIDSLQNKIKQLGAERTELRNGAWSIRDSVTVNILFQLVVSYAGNNPEKAMDFANQCLTLSRQIGFTKGVATAFRNIGIIYSEQGDYPEALKNLFASVEVSKTIGDKRRVSKAYNSIGNVYNNQGNYPEALKMLYTSLKLNEELKDKDGIAMALFNIGNIKSDLGNYSEALENFSASLEILEELGDKGSIGTALLSIGFIQSKLGNTNQALNYYQRSLKIAEQMGNKYEISYAYNNIGSVYFDRGKYNEALKNLFICLKILEEIGDKRRIASTKGNIGEVYTKLKRATEGKVWLKKGLVEAKQVGAKETIKSIYDKLAVADSALGNYKSALENYKMSILYRDSLLNNENTKKITQQQMQYDFDKKEALTKADQEKKDAVALEEIENQKLVRNGFMGGFATVLIFAGTFFRQRNKIHKEKKRSDHLLRNILPDEVAEELKETGSSKAKTHEMVSVMFTDFKDFTKISETVSAEMLVDELHTCFSAFDTILHKHNIEKIKTIGDAYMCVSGLPVANESHATDMVKASVEIMDYITARKKEKDAKGEFSFELRIGINSGPVVAGIVGLKKFSYDIWGDTVNTAARMEHQGEAGKINISGTTYEMIKHKFTSTHRGKITAKNKGEIDMYFVNGH